ncbi:gluconokinase [Vibrio panuliri]|uniref:Gluconokinase n=1 Tax=Vibrio panuliri TaxID=1381081 RepID=A0A1Q9HNR7_9VIBR|nr:gluconokinase [Vibrio panuliri]KAB1460393.1 gluconokinase [Vibrio panuliri]OLQ86692.1 gluconate kinase [Vibrio panuliri]OLQ92475.1 gluconate kinase [Vibrio panuliri]
MLGNCIIVMGVTSSGKSTVGDALAKAINAKFIDGDDLHPKSNILKMASGHPLNDDDRAPWLERIRDAVFSLTKKNESGVIVCSALKKKYRDIIREGNPNVRFVYLRGDQQLILDRIKARNGHFMKESMVASQFDALEEPNAEETDVITTNIADSVEDIVVGVVDQIACRSQSLKSQQG